MFKVGTPLLLLKINTSLYVKTSSGEVKKMTTKEILNSLSRDNGMLISASTKPGTLISYKYGDLSLLGMYFNEKPDEIVRFEHSKFKDIDKVNLHQEDVYVIRAIRCENGVPQYYEYLYIPRELNESEIKYLCKFVIDNCKKVDVHDAREPVIPLSLVYGYLRGISEMWNKEMTPNG